MKTANVIEALGALAHEYRLAIYRPGQPMTAHWGIEDPAAVECTETGKWLAFRTAFRELENRIKVFTALPIRSLDRAKLQVRLDEVGAT